MIELYKFQQKAVDKLSGPGPNGAPLASRLLGDDMGLGKTVEGVAIDLELRKQHSEIGASVEKTLIIAPLSTHEGKDGWKGTLIALGVSPKKIVVIDRKNRDLFLATLRMPFTHYICHYDAVRIEWSRLSKIRWFHIICDEVHRIKNKKSQQTRAVKNLPTVFKTGLSGTPADDKPADLWSVLNWLWPTYYRSYWKYVKHYCVETLKPGRGGVTYRDYNKVNKDNLPYLWKEMEPWYIRRLKKDVFKELPDKYYTTVEVDLLPKQRKAYDEMRRHMLTWVGEHEETPLTAKAVVSQLVRLQQFALGSAEIEYKKVRDRKTGEIKKQMVVRVADPSSKMDALIERVQDMGDRQLIVFSQSRSAIELAGKRLSAIGVSTALYTGAIPQPVRNRDYEEFQKGNLQVFAGTIKAGGEGLNLQNSSTVAFLDRDWNPAKNVQAEDRAHRIGQKNAVQVIDFVARNTVDLGRLQVIATKWQQVKLLLGDTPDYEAYTQALLTDEEVDPLIREAVHDTYNFLGR